MSSRSRARHINGRWESASGITKSNAKRLALEAANGWMRAYVIYVKDEPAAFWICTVYRDTVYSDYTGYDPQYKKYEIGTALFLRMVGETCAKN